jgi:hypothetical protein
MAATLAEIRPQAPTGACAALLARWGAWIRHDAGNCKAAGWHRNGSVGLLLDPKASAGAAARGAFLELTTKHRPILRNFAGGVWRWIMPVEALPAIPRLRAPKAGPRLLMLVLVVADDVQLVEIETKSGEWARRRAG